MDTKADRLGIRIDLPDIGVGSRQGERAPQGAQVSAVNVEFMERLRPFRSPTPVYRGVDAKSAVASFDTSTRVMKSSRNGTAITPYRCDPTLFK